MRRPAPRPAPVALGLTLALALLSAACSGGDGGGGGGDGADYYEQEPNDTRGTANALGDAVTFAGVCEPETDDWFSLEVSANGTLAVSLAWQEGVQENDLDLAVYDDAGDLLAEDITAAPNDSPAEVELAVSSGGTYAILVDCFLVYEDVEYLGTVTRP